MTLAEQFSRELKTLLRADPEMAVELESPSALRSWVAERVRDQLENDDMSRAVKAFIRLNLPVAVVMKHLEKL